MSADMDTMQQLIEWDKAKQQLNIWKAKENTLRTQIFGKCFPDAEEGTHHMALNDGYKLKGVAKLSRNVDEAALPAVTKKMENCIPIDQLIKYTPSLMVANYRKINDFNRNILDEALIIKPGAPTLEIVVPKDKK